MKFLRLTAALAVALIPLAIIVPARAAVYPGLAADGAYVSAETQVNASTLDITVSSPDAQTSVPVELLLPPGWSASATQTWPVLYLLHGCCDAYQGWNTDTDLAQVTAGAPVIIALPDGGPVGLYTDWYDGTGDWEQFTATELPQILTSGFHASSVSAIGGVSTGGGAALFIAAHHPGQYAAAASYSGTDCLLEPIELPVVEGAIIRAGYKATGPWGSPFTNLSVWQQHDPCYLASSLRGTKLFLSVGTGLTSSGTTTSCPAGGNILESLVAPGVYSLATLLTLDGISYTSDFYNGGCHSWPYWQTAFIQSWPMLESALGV